MEKTPEVYWRKILRSAEQQLASAIEALAEAERLRQLALRDLAEAQAGICQAHGELLRLAAPTPAAVFDSQADDELRTVRELPPAIKSGCVPQPDTASSAPESSDPVPGSGRGSEDAPPFDPSAFRPATAGAPSASSPGEAPPPPSRAVDIARSATEAQKLAVGTAAPKWEKICVVCLGQPFHHAPCEVPGCDHEEPCPACGSADPAEEVPQAEASVPQPDAPPSAGDQELLLQARKEAVGLMAQIGWPKPDTPDRMEGLKLELEGILGYPVEKIGHLAVGEWLLVNRRLRLMLEAGPSGKEAAGDPAGAAAR